MTTTVADYAPRRALPFTPVAVRSTSQEDLLSPAEEAALLDEREPQSWDEFDALVRERAAKSRSVR
jgi:hypothetical protein